MLFAYQPITSRETCECAGWSGFMLVANALCWFCRDTAQLLSSCSLILTTIVNTNSILRILSTSNEVIVYYYIHMYIMFDS
jgi:hypothetical protein